jgi:riboflavin synthase
VFTGIVTAIGTVTRVDRRDDLRLTIACPYDPAVIAIGASIACAGVCLTVVDRGGVAGDAWFAVDVSAETASRTAIGGWREGARLNLEQALRLGDELGGHIVTGHVDGLGRVVSTQPCGGSTLLAVSAMPELAPYLTGKGSITLDGVSLTINRVDDESDGSVRFGVNLIPHTAEATTLGELRPHDAVHLEIDVLARYLRRMQSLRETAG